MTRFLVIHLTVTVLVLTGLHFLREEALLLPKYLGPWQVCTIQTYIQECLQYLQGLWQYSRSYLAYAVTTA
jgi:hypothetical protein